MKVEADLSTIHSLLNDEKPEGVTVEKSGGAIKAFNLNVDINIDLTTITSTVAAAWILARAAIQSRSKIKVNGQLLPPDEAGASKMIIDAIHDEEEKKGASQ
jgi:hypothetical protein